MPTNTETVAVPTGLPNREVERKAYDGPGPFKPVVRPMLHKVDFKVEFAALAKVDIKSIVKLIFRSI